MFADTESKRFESQFTKPVFFKTSPGQHIIRILDDSAQSFYTHWINGMGIYCSVKDEGSYCPQCEQNKKIRLENPENFKDIPGYIPYRRVFFTNVLDRTLAKVCPECGAEVKQVVSRSGNLVFPSTCTCSAFVQDVEAKPLNIVKALIKGVEMFDQFNVLQRTVLDRETREPLGINNFDIALEVTGVGKNSKPRALPLAENNDKIDSADYKLFTLQDVIFKLSPTEMLDFMRGVAFKDIMAARRANKESPVVAAVKADKTEQELQRLDGLVKDLFGE